MKQRLVKTKLNMPTLFLILGMSCLLNATTATAKQSPSQLRLDTAFDCESFNTAVAIIDDVEDTRIHVIAALGLLTNRCGDSEPARGLQILHRISRMDFSIGQPISHLFLGLAYLQGWGVLPDPAEARYWFRRATIRFTFSDTKAIETIFHNTRQGHGMKSLPSLLLEEIKNVDAMRHASPEEHFKTYRALWFGQGLPMDRPSAERFLHRAVDRHLPQALHEHGLLILERKVNMILQPRKELIKLALTSLAVAAGKGYGPAEKKLGLYCWKHGTTPEHKLFTYVLLRRAFNRGLTEVETAMADVYQSLPKVARRQATSFIEENVPIPYCSGD